MKAQNNISQEIEIGQLITSPDIKSLWSDNFSLAFRNDGIVILRAFSGLPEGNIEQTRIVTNTTGIERFIDYACKIMKYTPKEPIGYKEQASSSPSDG